VGAASAWDMAFLSHLFGGFIGFLHGARIFESEGIRVDALGAMLADIAPVIGEMIRHEGNLIQADDYANPAASLQTSAFTFDLLLKQAREEGITSDFPTFAAQFFKKGLDAGYGHEDTAALIKAMRQSA
jgi:3-hydroxyisobutyrate dehydrogenase-like beta-hydroxyacid dehydrogenase